MKLTIDLDKLRQTAFKHMDAQDDVHWSIGMAIEQLYWEDGIEELQRQLVADYCAKHNQTNEVFN